MFRLSLAAALVLLMLSAWAQAPSGGGSRTYYLEAARSRVSSPSTGTPAVQHRTAPNQLHDSSMMGRHQGGGRSSMGDHRESSQERHYPLRYGYSWPYYYTPYYYGFNYWGYTPYTWYQPYSAYAMPYYMPYCGPYFVPRYYGLIRPYPILFLNTPIVFGGYYARGRSFGFHFGGRWRW